MTVGRSIAGASKKRLALAIVGVCIGVYHANGRPHPEVDCVAAPYTAWSLLRDRSLDVSPYRDLDYLVGTAHLVDLPDGSRVSLRPPGSALAAIPVVAPLAVVHEEPPRPAVMLCLGKLAGAACMAVAAALLFLSLDVLAPAARWSGTVLFAFGTCAWTVAGQALWTHGPATMWVMLGMYLLLRELQGGTGSTWPFCVAGIAFGLAHWTRSSTILIGLAAGVALLAMRNWRGAAACLLGVLPFLLGLCWMNLRLFGAPVLGGYATDGGFGTPLHVGLPGLLIAPSRGLFVYSPGLVLAPLGLWAIGRETRWRNVRPLLFALFAAVMATVILHARWYDWWGGWCYGPRFLIETLPVWCLLFGIAVDSFPSRFVRGSAWTLVVLSVFVHLIGMAGHSEYVRWNERHNSYADGGRSLFSFRDTQISAHWQGSLNKVLGRKDTARSSEASP